MCSKPLFFRSSDMLTIPEQPPARLSGTKNSQATAVFRFALIGLGKIGRVHLDNIAELEHAKVVAIAEPNKANLKGLDESIRLFDSWSEILSDPEIDGVIITLPHSMHAECAMLALENGKHVFLEKPLATTLEDAQRLMKCAQEMGLTLMVNMTHRFYPPLRIARRMLQEGVVGDVISVHDHYMEVIDRADFPAWFFDPKIAGGGVTMTDSIHLVDRVSWLIGEPLQLKGQVSRTLDPGSKIEDCSELICQSPSGMPVTVGSFFSFDGAKTWNDRLTLFGTKGTLVVHAWSHLEWTPHAEKTQRIEGYPPGLSHLERAGIGHRAAMEEFLAAVDEKRISEAEASCVMNAHEIIHDFYHNLSF